MICIAMDTTFVLNNFQKFYIFVTAFLLSVKNSLYIIVFVSMVTRFNFIAMDTQFSYRRGGGEGCKGVEGIERL